MTRLTRSLRKHGGRRLLAWPVLACVVLTLALATAPMLQAQEARRDQLWQFVDDVLLRYWVGEAGETVWRWSHDPKVALLSGTDDDERMLRDIIRDVNSVLADIEVAIEFVGVGRHPADIQVLILPRNGFEVFAKTFGVAKPRYFDGPFTSEGFSMYWDDDRNQTVYATVVVAEETSAARRHAVMSREFLHTLGMHGYSTVFPESALFGRAQEVESRPRLALIDRKLLRFLYQHLEPGDTWVAVHEAFQRHWPE